MRSWWLWRTRTRRVLVHVVDRWECSTMWLWRLTDRRQCAALVVLTVLAMLLGCIRLLLRDLGPVRLPISTLVHGRHILLRRWRRPRLFLQIHLTLEYVRLNPNATLSLRLHPLQIRVVRRWRSRILACLRLGPVSLEDTLARPPRLRSREGCLQDGAGCNALVFGVGQLHRLRFGEGRQRLVVRNLGRHLRCFPIHWHAGYW